MLRYGFVEQGLRTISNTCDPGYAASVADLRKIGMHQVGNLAVWGSMQLREPGRKVFRLVDDVAGGGRGVLTNRQ
jgi:hypothetical protein